MSGTERRHTQELFNTFVGGLPFYCEDDELRSFMSQYGKVAEVFISRDASSHNHKGYAFVAFHSVSNMKNLFGAHLFKGKMIEVKRNIHNQVLITGLTPDISEADIKAAIEDAGFPVSEILVGSEGNGVPVGSACAKLINDELLPALTDLGTLLVKDTLLELNTCSTRKPNQPNTPKDSASSKKQKNSRKFNQQEISDKKNHKTGHHPVAPSIISNEAYGEQDSALGMFSSFTKMSPEDSALSTLDFSQAFNEGSLPSGQKMRKMSSSLKTNSKEYHPSPSNADVLALLGEDALFDDTHRRVLLNGRHNSDSANGSHDTHYENVLNRRLSSYSSCFYTSDSPVQNEVRIAFFTFPGRE